MINTPALSPLAVWVVDDHPTNRLVLARQLRLLGHHPTVAACGESALRGWREQPGDVIIVDIHMPGMDGYQFCSLLRQHEAKAARTPCVILGYTANAGPVERERCQQAGMNDCLPKSIDLAQLGAHLSQLQKPPPSTLDVSVLHNLTGGHPQRMERLLDEILNSCRQDRMALQALHGEPRAPLLELSHHILGAARVVGARDVALACEALEAEARRARPKGLASHRQTLLARLQALEQTLQSLLPESRRQSS